MLFDGQSELKPGIHTVWAAYKLVSDRGHLGDRLGVYSTEELARIAAKGHGDWGGDGKVREKQALCIGVDGAAYYYVLEDAEQHGVLLSDEQAVEDLKARALGKLDDDERKALGGS